MGTRVFAAAVLFNVFSSVGVSVTNKLALAQAGVELAPALTLLHFTSTAVYTSIIQDTHSILQLRQLFSQPNSVLFSILAVAFLNTCSVVLTITSVGRNTIEFYQLVKLLALPCTVAIEYFVHGSRYGPRELTSLFMVLSGVGLATVQHIRANVTGATIAVAAVLATSVAQVTYSKMLQQRTSASKSPSTPGEMTKTQQLSSQQITLVIYAASSLMLLAGGMVFAPAKTWPLVLFKKAGWRVPLSCALAISINWSTSRVLELSSAVTYLVVGQAKVCLTLGVGWLLFKQAPTAKGLFGTAVALIGMFWYSLQKQRKKDQQKGTNDEHTKKA